MDLCPSRWRIFIRWWREQRQAPFGRDAARVDIWKRERLNPLNSPSSALCMHGHAERTIGGGFLLLIPVPGLIKSEPDSRPPLPRSRYTVVVSCFAFQWRMEGGGEGEIVLLHYRCLPASFYPWLIAPLAWNTWRIFTFLFFFFALLPQLIRDP